MKILGIETSFDETAVAVVEDGTTVLSTVLTSSHDLHAQFGGILPELAAREQYSYILPVLTQALESLQQTKNESIRQTIERTIDAIAVTNGPGLIGSLLIGVEAAKTIAWVCNKPLIPVNHVIAHIYANFINHQPLFPAIALVASGAHTELFLMESEKTVKWLGGTVDDAAGEAFDKTARLLGFGNRGGTAIEEAARTQGVSVSARQGVKELRLPRPLMHDGTFNFSFSGLKTAVQREWNNPERTRDEALAYRFAHEIQEAITDVLVTKTIAAAEHYGVQTILLAGGVAANIRLREKFGKSAENMYTVLAPPRELCTDNAVPIASYACYRGAPEEWQTVTAIPNLSVEVST